MVIGRRAEQKKKIPTGAVIAVICTLAVVLIYLGFCTVASMRSTIFPRVKVVGVNVSGMSLSEAKAAVEGELGGGGNVLVVRLPDNTLEIQVDDVMGDIDIDGCLNAAYQFGRGNFFTGGFSFISSIFMSRDFALDLAEIDELYLRDYAAVAAAEFGGEKVESSYIVSEESLLLSVGRPAMTIDAGELYELILDAFKKMDFSDIEYLPLTDDPKPIDLEAIWQEVYVEKVPATVDNMLNVTPEVVGISFDLEEARRLLNAAEAGDIVTIPLIRDIPEETVETLAAVLCVDVLAEYSTYVTSNSNRNNNISLAASSCNGTVIMPGSEFSFNGTVGQRTTERGYKLAGAYVNGAVVDEVGGGICQVSSTIYMTCLLANLEITDRSCHQFVVTYLPYGMDATVNWGTTDYKFKNNTNYPIKIEAWLADGAVTVRILGTKPDSTSVKMTYEITGTYPFETVEEESDTIAEGETSVKTTGSTGYSVRTYRQIYAADGSLISSNLEASSYYTKRNKVILVPVGSLNPEDPVVSDPQTTDPGVSDPGTTDPGVSDPGTTDTGTTDPGVTNPGTNTDPGTAVEA